jgi:hypothetical protein
MQKTFVQAMHKQKKVTPKRAAFPLENTSKTQAFQSHNCQSCQHKLTQRDLCVHVCVCVRGVINNSPCSTTRGLGGVSKQEVVLDIPKSEHSWVSGAFRAQDPAALPARQSVGRLGHRRLQTGWPNHASLGMNFPQPRATLG